MREVRERKRERERERLKRANYKSGISITEKTVSSIF